MDDPLNPEWLRNYYRKRYPEVKTTHVVNKNNYNIQGLMDPQVAPRFKGSIDFKQRWGKSVPSRPVRPGPKFFNPETSRPETSYPIPMGYGVSQGADILVNAKNMPMDAHEQFPEGYSEDPHRDNSIAIGYYE